MPQIPWKLVPATISCQFQGTVVPDECIQDQVTQRLPLVVKRWKTSIHWGVVLGATFLGGLTTLAAQDVPGSSWSNYGFSVQGGATGATPYYYPQAGAGVPANTPLTNGYMPDGSMANGSMMAQPTPAGIAPYSYSNQPVDPSGNANQSFMTGNGTASGYGTTVTLSPYAAQNALSQNHAVQGRLPSPALPGPTYQSGYASGAKYFQPGGYDARIGSPYYYDGNERSTVTGDPYVDHFGPGFHRNQVHGHYRFPYYTYRAPWYYPGRAVYNRDTNYAW